MLEGNRCLLRGEVIRIRMSYRESFTQDSGYSHELLTTLDHSVSSVDISLVNALPLQRDLAFMLARKLPGMSEEECEKILSILKEGD